MTITFRPARVEEHNQLVTLARQSPYTKDFSNRVMFSSDAAYEKGWITVAEQDGKIVAMSCVRHKVRDPETMLYFVVVDRHCRSRAIGRRLLQHVMDEGPWETMRLGVMKENKRAVAFYLELGFRIVHDRHYGGEAYLMEKEWS